MRLLLLTLATMTVAAVVSVTGLISFVGLLAPHSARLLAGHNRRSACLLSGLLGSALLLAADTLAKTAASTELPVSIFTSLLGVPFLLYLILWPGRMRHDATNHAPARGALRAGPHRTVRHSGRAARGQLFCPGVRAADRAAGGKRQRQDHAAQGGRPGCCPTPGSAFWTASAGEPVHPQAGADRQLYPAAERHLGLALGAGGRAYGLQPAAGDPAKPPPPPCAPLRTKPCAP